MTITNEMAEAALDALDDACIGFNRSNPRVSVHWKGFTRDDRVAAIRTALSAALAKRDAAIALMRGQSEDDAERYRFLRDHHSERWEDAETHTHLSCTIEFAGDGHDIDAAVDAAMQQTEKK